MKSLTLAVSMLAAFPGAAQPSHTLRSGPAVRAETLRAQCRAACAVEYAKELPGGGACTEACDTWEPLQRVSDLTSRAVSKVPRRDERPPRVPAREQIEQAWQSS